MSQTMEKTEQSGGFMRMLASGTLRIIVSLIIPLLAFVVLAWSVTYMTNADAPKAIRAVVALVVGVGGIWVLYIAFDNLVSLLPVRMREGVRPFVFVGPALVIITVYLLYPAVDTIIRSFQDARSVNFIGLENYKFIFTDPSMLIVLRNNLLWLVFVTSFAVGLGLVIAVMVDRIRWESAVKSIIFLPMAISAVGASVIWKFIYTFRPAGRPQIGLLNAIPGVEIPEVKFNKSLFSVKEGATALRAALGDATKALGRDYVGIMAKTNEDLGAEINKTAALLGNGRRLAESTTTTPTLRGRHVTGWSTS